MQDKVCRETYSLLAGLPESLGFFLIQINWLIKLPILPVPAYVPHLKLTATAVFSRQPNLMCCTNI